MTRRRPRFLDEDEENFFDSYNDLEDNSFDDESLASFNPELTEYEDLDSLIEEELENAKRLRRTRKVTK